MPLSLPPLGVALLARQLRQLSLCDFSPGVLASAARLLSHYVHAGALLGSVSGLDRVEVDLRSHVKSWLPGAHFAVLAHPEPRLLHLDRHSTEAGLPAPGFTTQLALARGQLTSEWVTAALAPAWQVQGVYEARLPAESARWWGTQNSSNSRRPYRTCRSCISWCPPYGARRAAGAGWNSSATAVRSARRPWRARPPGGARPGRPDRSGQAADAHRALRAEADRIAIVPLTPAAGPHPARRAVAAAVRHRPRPRRAGRLGPPAVVLPALRRSAGVRSASSTGCRSASARTSPSCPGGTSRWSRTPSRISVRPILGAPGCAVCRPRLPDATGRRGQGRGTPAGSPARGLRLAHPAPARGAAAPRLVRAGPGHFAAGGVSPPTSRSPACPTNPVTSATGGTPAPGAGPEPSSATSGLRAPPGRAAAHGPGRSRGRARRAVRRDRRPCPQPAPTSPDRSART